MTQKLKQAFHVDISLLTPLHIGSGRELLHEYDYVIRNNQTWIINEDALWEHLLTPEGEFDNQLLGRPAHEFLQPQDYQNSSSLMRYVLPGAPRAKGHGAVLREQYKDVYDRPLLPGSSIKGALRTVLAWHGFQETGQKLAVNELRGGRSWVGQSMEHEIFGQNPNYDLLRGLHVADSAAKETDRLQILNAQVVTGGEKMGAPIEMEAIRSDTVFETTLTIDNYLGISDVRRQLRWGDHWQWLTDLPQIAQRYVLERVQTEGRWFQERRYVQVAGFYQQLEQILKSGRLGDDKFLIQIGWGGGWLGKTIGLPLQQDSEQWERLLGQRRLSPARVRRRQGDAFPKSRRVVTARGQAAAPLGWCLVEMTERKD